jgi:hypothetical protein
MTNTHVITINGQQYDAVTGLPISAASAPQHEAPKPAPAKIIHHKPATVLHATPQRSITLNRKSTKRPVPLSKTIHHHPKISPAGHVATNKLHADVKRFAPHPVGALKPARVMDIGPVAHPHVTKAHVISAAKAQQQSHKPAPTAKEIADSALTTAIKKTETKKQPLKSKLRPHQRTAAVLSAVLALVILGGYLTYLNMPGLSVRVAAAQAGIEAGYPEYRPDGYALSGPVTYSDGRVSMNFKANGGNQQYAINQSKSGWNNEAVLDNYVSPRAGSSYIPYTERGLTIYTYDNNAAWVNGGILYTVEGNAPLSSEQIRRIATSLL